MQDDESDNALDFDEVVDDTQTTEKTTETSSQPTETQEKTTAQEGTDSSETEKTDTGGGETEEAAEQTTATEETQESSVEQGGQAGEPKQEEPAKPLTAEEARKLFTDIRDQERNSTKALQEAEQEVLNAYHPDGLPDVVVTTDGKELRTPQDVVDASGGEMSMEEAANWLMNEQAKLDRQINDIKKSARELAEVNYNFKQGAVRVLEKYQPIFDKYPQLQNKIFKNYMKTVKMDNEKDLILAAPDIEDYYADVMEPYVMAFGYSQSQAQTQPAATTTEEEKPKIPESKQTVVDRMDVSGDAGGSSDSTVDPNDPESTLNNLFGE